MSEDSITKFINGIPFFSVFKEVEKKTNKSGGLF